MLEVAIIGLFILLFLSAFFSGAESALLSLDRVQLENIKRQKAPGYKALTKLYSNQRRMLITILIGNNIVNISLSALATLVASALFGNETVGYVIGVVTFLILVFGEIIPKNFCATYSPQISLIVASPLNFFAIIFKPLIWILLGINHIIFSIFGVQETEDITTEEEIKTIVALGRKSGAINKHASEIIHDVIDFNNTTAEEIMTPIKDVFSLPANMLLDDAKNQIITRGFSRIPIYEESTDNFVGVLHVSEVLKRFVKGKRKIKLKNLNLSPLFIVPETKPVSKLLKDFQAKRTHMAAVVDEYGNVIGIATLEEVLEELVGEIIDETDSNEELILKVKEKEYIIDGRATLEEISEETPLNFESDEVNTINGYILANLGRVPRTGEKFTLNRRKFEVISRTRVQVKKVKIMA